MARQPRVFLSYAHADQPFVERLATDLENRGVDLWLDEKEIAVGQSVSEAIEEAIASVDAVCLVLSTHSLHRPWVQREYRAALSLQLSTPEAKPTILPLRIDAVEVPPLLRDIKCAEFQIGYARALGLVCSALGIPNTPAPFLGLLDLLDPYLPGAVENLKGALWKVTTDPNWILWDVWGQIESGDRQTIDELRDSARADIQRVTIDTIDPGAVETTKNLTVLTLPMIEIFQRNDWNSVVSADVELTGVEALVGALSKYKRQIASRQVYLLPVELRSDRDGPHEDDGPSTKHVSLVDQVIWTH